jgi:hypothetical protein
VTPSDRDTPASAERGPRDALAGKPRQALEMPRPAQRGSLLDVLDRVLDKGVVIAGDISISLLDIELLTIKIRLLIASADKAREMGIDWWAHDPQLSGGAARRQQKLDADRENGELRRRIEELESRLNALPDQHAEGRSRGQVTSRGRGKGDHRG